MLNIRSSQRRRTIRRVSHHDSQAAYSVIGNRNDDVEREGGLGLRSDQSDIRRISELSKPR